MTKFLTSKKASIGTAALSAFSLKLCCWGPLMLTGVAGISGSTAYFSWLTVFRPYILALALFSLGFAFYQAYKPIQKDECENCNTEKTSFFKSKMYVWLVATFILLMSLISYYPQLFYSQTDIQIASISQSDIQSVKLNISGMTCAGCEENINHSVKKIDGVLKVNASYKKDTVEIEFDSSKTTISKMESVIESKGYIIIKSTK